MSFYKGNSMSKRPFNYVIDDYIEGFMKDDTGRIPLKQGTNKYNIELVQKVNDLNTRYTKLINMESICINLIKENEGQAKTGSGDIVNLIRLQKAQIQTVNFNKSLRKALKTYVVSSQKIYSSIILNLKSEEERVVRNQSLLDSLIKDIGLYEVMQSISKILGKDIIDDAFDFRSSDEMREKYGHLEDEGKTGEYWTSVSIEYINRLKQIAKENNIDFNYIVSSYLENRRTVVSEKLTTAKVEKAEEKQARLLEKLESLVTKDNAALNRDINRSYDEQGIRMKNKEFTYSMLEAVKKLGGKVYYIVMIKKSSIYYLGKDNTPTQGISTMKLYETIEEAEYTLTSNLYSEIYNQYTLVEPMSIETLDYRLYHPTEQQTHRLRRLRLHKYIQGEQVDFKDDQIIRLQEFRLSLNGQETLISDKQLDSRSHYIPDTKAVAGGDTGVKQGVEKVSTPKEKVVTTKEKVTSPESDSPTEKLSKQTRQSILDRVEEKISYAYKKKILSVDDKKFISRMYTLGVRTSDNTIRGIIITATSRDTLKTQYITMIGNNVGLSTSYGDALVLASITPENKAFIRNSLVSNQLIDDNTTLLPHKVFIPDQIENYKPNVYTDDWVHKSLVSIRERHDRLVNIIVNGVTDTYATPGEFALNVGETKQPLINLLKQLDNISQNEVYAVMLGDATLDSVPVYARDIDIEKSRSIWTSSISEIKLFSTYESANAYIKQLETLENRRVGIKYVVFIPLYTFHIRRSHLGKKEL